MQYYKGKEVVDLDTETFRKQLLIYIVWLCIYRHCVEKKSYDFPKIFEWSDLLKKAFKKRNVIHEIIKNIMESKKDF